MVNKNNQKFLLAFAQNQREELRDLNNIAISLSAERGTHQQNFIVCIKKKKDRNSNKDSFYE